MMIPAVLFLYLAAALQVTLSDEQQFTTWKDKVHDTIITSFVTNDESGKDVKLLPLNDERYTRQATEGQEEYLLFANREFLAQVYLNGTVRNTFSVSFANTVGVDFDAREGLMFWSDTRNSLIAMATLDGSNAQLLVSVDIDIPDGMAWDWITKKLYWTDFTERDIEVLDLERSSRKVLFTSPEGSYLRAIVVDPTTRTMYWTDWGNNSRIEKASMDGSSREAIVTTSIVWPNGLTLDYSTQTLYWADAFLHTLESSRTDGSNRMLLNDIVLHPFGITFYRNTLYWGDWTTQRIYSAPLSDPNTTTIVFADLTNDPMAIHVVSEERQPPAINPCSTNNGGCEYLCLLSSTSEEMYTCQCPNGVDVMSDGKACNTFRFGFEMSTYTAVESEERIVICLSADRGDGSEVYMVTMVTLNQTAGVNDYKEFQQNVTISAVSKRSCVNITLTNDNVPEVEEFFLVALINVRRISANVPSHQVTISLTNVTIIDDDAICDPPCVNGVCMNPGECLCHDGWTGVDCSRGMCEPPCLFGTCNISTEMCECYEGRTGAGCNEDINECEINNGECQQLCHNLPGGYNCSCRDGFTPDKDNENKCSDIDECSEGTDECSQNCVNTPGSYYCTCERGFRKFNNTQCEDINECTLLPNGYCQHICNNTVGSYTCECREGFRAVGRFLCTDINECVQETDNCSRSDPAPATCINDIGDYRCSCDNYIGFRLAQDYRSCEDVDECTEDIHACSDTCVNNVGSYSCSCSTGFTLSTDSITCNDNDECLVNNGGCNHTCTNTYGSYFCSCYEGFELVEDNMTCRALSCPLLEAPANGSIVCDTQTIGVTCSFSCESTYTLRGSTSRSCLPSLEWTGQPTVCDPPMCPELTPPDNGFVLFPCSREESHTCSVVCAHGYNISGSPQQTCELDSVSDNLLWTAPPMCQESDACTPNPCLHGGICTQAGNSFTCDCSTTNYTGMTCNIGVILLPPIPILLKNEPYSIRVSTRFSIQSKIAISLKNNGVRIPGNINLQRQRNTGTVMFTPKEAGIHKLTHEHIPTDLFEVQPSELTVFVREKLESTHQSNTYFTLMGLRLGQLRKGCCVPQEDILLSCPKTTYKVALKAACQWQCDGTTHWAPGVVFADGRDLSLPVSIAGYTRSHDSEGAVLSQTSQCTPCNSDEAVCMQKTFEDDCYCYNFTGGDTQDFLNTRALGLTYIEQMQNLLPTWLKLQVNLDNSSTTALSEHDYLAPVVQSHLDVPKIEGCSKITPITHGVYSVLRYNSILSGELNGQTYAYNGDNNIEGSDDPLCFAINLCQGRESSVLMQLSQPIHNIVVSEHLRRFVNKGWKIQLNTVMVSRTQMRNTSDRLFWNGIRAIVPPLFMPDVKVNMNVQATFTSDSLRINVTFIGDASIQYQERIGCLFGETTLSIQHTINGDEQLLKLRSQQEAYYSIQDGDPCSKRQDQLPGLSFRASYKHLVGETFFSQLITFNEVTQECPFDVFIPIDGNYTAHGVSMHTECPLLSIGKLVFPDMSHVMNIIGQSPNCFQDDFLGVPDPAFVIHSNLKNSYLPLGQFLELQRRRNGDDMITVFSQNQEGFIAMLHSVKVSLFRSIFVASARIKNNFLNISGSTNVFQYPAYVHISALVNETDWNQLSHDIHGKMLLGENSFPEAVESAVLSELQQAAESGASRQMVAQISYNQSIMRFNDIEHQYNMAVDAEQEANQSYSRALQEANLALSKRLEAESVFNSSSEEIQELERNLSKLCTEMPCENVCMRGMSCRNCSRPTFIGQTGQCPVTVTETRSIRVPPFFAQRITWRFELICRTQRGRICSDSTCLDDPNNVCYGRCVPVTSTVPVFQWREEEFEVQRFENCTIQVFTFFIPDICCNYTDCAIRAPTNSCVNNSARCRQTRQMVLDNLTQAREDVKKPFQNLQEARKNLSLAQTAAISAQIKRRSTLQRKNQLLETLNRIKAARDRAKNVYEQTLENIEPLVRIGKILANNSGNVGNVFNITSINFNTVLTEGSPQELEMEITFETPYNMREFTKTFLYRQSRGIENIREIAAQITEESFIGGAKRHVNFEERLRRQNVEEESNIQVFDARCTHVMNTQQFLLDIQTKLQGIKESIESARASEALSAEQNVTDMDIDEAVNVTIVETELNITATDPPPTVDEEISAYLELLSTYEQLSADTVASLERNIFAEWQASMEFLYSESGSVGTYSCDGFVDCLQTAVDQLNILIQLTPEIELSEGFTILYRHFPTAGKQLLDLGLGANISIFEAIEKIVPIVDIMNAFAKDNYWCNSPPVITLQTPPEVNVSLGGTLQLVCEANSTLSLSYEWRKDGNTSPEFNTNGLVLTNLQRLDSGNYTCIANNPVGSAESISTSVTVYELPSFYLLPQSVATYFGDDNGAWFACNASAWPFPGWRWYYRASEEMEWTLIEGEETNELLIPEPQKEHEGWYVCEAYNYHGSIRSEPVSLLLLPFSVSQQQYPLEFSIYKSIPSEPSCSNDDLLDAVYHKISKTISSDTVVISGLTVVEVDSENYDVRLSLSSENVTTGYLHLTAFSEIANNALPKIKDLQKSVESVTHAFDQDNVTVTCHKTQFTVDSDSVIFDKLTYTCPHGQQLSSDYLLCLSCELGTFSEETDRSRIVNGKGFSEKISVCQPCPLGTYTEEIGSSTCQQCPKYHTTDMTGSSSISDCIPQNLLLECGASGSGDHVVVDCQSNRPPLFTVCSFDDGLKHSCSYPLAINLGVSPPGSHSLRIIIEDDEGFTAEDSVSYFIESDSAPTVPAQVPPLTVHFVNDSPRVMDNSVEADILLSRPVQSLVCNLRSTSVDVSMDCSNGQAQFFDLEPGRYILRVVATNQVPDKELIRRGFEISDDPTLCTVHLINNGVTVVDSNATVEFAGTGPAQGYKCRLNRQDYYECSSPVMMSGLANGSHQIRVVPSGCGRNRKVLKANFAILVS